MDTLFSRTCCRVFDNTKIIPKEDLELIIKAGQAAPSAKNRQPYFFIVVTNKECRKEIYLAAQEGRKKQFGNISEEEFKKTEKGDTGSNDISIYQSSACILVFRNSDIEYTEASTESKNLNIKEEQGVATAIYSMIIQAHSMGISSGWICSPLYIKDDLRDILTKYGVNFNDNWEPRCVIPLGYTSLKTNKPERKDIKEISIFID